MIILVANCKYYILETLSSLSYTKYSKYIKLTSWRLARKILSRFLSNHWWSGVNMVQCSDIEYTTIKILIYMLHSLQYLLSMLIVSCSWRCLKTTFLTCSESPVSSSEASSLISFNTVPSFTSRILSHVTGDWFRIFVLKLLTWKHQSFLKLRKRLLKRSR